MPPRMRSRERLHGTVTGTTDTETIMEAYIIVFRYKREDEKKLGPVRQFRIYANDLEAAQREAERYANYPNIEVLDVHPV